MWTATTTGRGILEDSELLADVELPTTLMTAANEAASPLTTQAIDRILRVRHHEAPA